MNFDDILYKRVSWEKLAGKPNASMQETKGFGILTSIGVGTRLTILGDFGVWTTAAKTIETVECGLQVVTKNSTYLVKVIE